MLDQAKVEIADSIFFHASELNQVVYNHSWQQLVETNKRKKPQVEERKEPLIKKVLNKARSGILGSLGAVVDERVVYPANTLMFAILFCVVIYMLSNSGDRITRFISPMIYGYEDKSKLFPGFK